MKERERAADTHAVIKDSKQFSAEEMRERKERLLTQGTPSITGSIADALVLKHRNVFFLAKPNGNVPEGGEHGFGFYFHDCRFLNTYELKIADADPNVLVSTDDKGFSSVIELTNPEIMLDEGKHLRRDEIGITWNRVIDGQELALHDLITFKNYELNEVEFPISLTFNSQFESVFAVRGLLPIYPGSLHPPEWNDNALSFVYTGADGLYRGLFVHFSIEPVEINDRTAYFNIHLEPGQSKRILVSLFITETQSREEISPKRQKQPEIDEVQPSLLKTPEYWQGRRTEIRTDSLLLNNLLDRSLLDLQMLRTEIEGDNFFAAGVPWFVTLFGRDAIITALQTLIYDPSIAAETLRILAGYQGKKVDQWRDEEPGKILHELRVGELARINEIPHTPYYGTVDATPLFLVLAARYTAWTGDLDLFEELRDNIEQALQWMAEYGDLSGAGYIEYRSLSGRGLVNQGWKDSGDAVVNADGSLTDPPIALVEVQSYAYMGKTLIADLYERVGEADRAEALRQEAAGLRARFNRDFWMDDLGTYLLALQKDQRPVAVVSSNPGHALWAGIADEDKARKTVSRLMESDMFSGWGIRTLSTKERRYNPIGYHLGTVWPHDNSIIVAGLRRYLFDEPARRVFMGMIEAAMHFNDNRLPELFAGFPRDLYHVPVHFPIACHPQAWAAGSIPFMLESFLGLVPEALDRRLRIVRPMLPDFLDQIEVRGMRVRNAYVDLEFTRWLDGSVSTEVLNVDGELDVVVDQE